MGIKKDQEAPQDETMVAPPPWAMVGLVVVAPEVLQPHISLSLSLSNQMGIGVDFVILILVLCG